LKPNEITTLAKKIGDYYGKPYTEPQLIQMQESLANMSGLLVDAAWQRYVETNTSDRRPTLGAILALCDEIRDTDRQFGQGAADQQKPEAPAAPVTVRTAWEQFDTEYRQWCAANCAGTAAFRELFGKMSEWVTTVIGDTDRMNDNEGGWLAAYGRIMAGLSRRRIELEQAGQWPVQAANPLHLSA
jgi:hypothetical protein